VVQLQKKQIQDATFTDSGWEGQALLTLARVDKYTLGKMLEKLCEVEGIAIPIRKDVREFMRKAVRTGTISMFKIGWIQCREIQWSPEWGGRD